MDQSPAVGDDSAIQAGLGSSVSLDYYNRAPFPFVGQIHHVNVRYTALIQRLCREVIPWFVTRPASKLAHWPPQSSQTNADWLTAVTSSHFVRALSSAQRGSCIRLIRQAANCAPPLGRGHKEVQAELAREKCGGQLALDTIAGCIEPRREGTQPALAG